MARTARTPSLTAGTSMLFFFSAASAWNAEYPGFIHVRNWAGTSKTVKHVVMPSGNPMPAEVAMGLCAAEPATTSIGWNGQNFRVHSADASQDTYIATNKSIVPAAVCQPEPHAPCTAPNSTWITCKNTDWCDDMQNALIATFQLPPDDIHTSCLKNPECVAFTVKNDGSAGSLIKGDDGCDSQSWYDISKMNTVTAGLTMVEA